MPYEKSIPVAISIATRKPFTTVQAQAIVAAASAAGLFATPIYDGLGRADEVSVYSQRELVASVFRPSGDPGLGLGVWFAGKGACKGAQSPVQAVAIVARMVTRGSEKVLQKAA